VKVKFGSHVSGDLRQGPPPGTSGQPNLISGSYVQQLGLSDAPIDISLSWRHKPLYVDDYGPDVPFDLMWMLAEANVRMTLVHYDDYVLQQCLIESMAGGGYSDPDLGPNTAFPGTLAGAGTLIGGNVEPFGYGWHYMSLSIQPGNLTNDQLQSGYRALPWRFINSVLAEPPITIPVGTSYSVTRLNWRVIPYGTYFTPGDYISGQVPILSQCEIASSGAILFDHFPDNV